MPFAALLLLLLLGGGTARAQSGSDWLPMSAGQSDGQDWRDESPSRSLSADLDMNGDGKRDRATLVVRRDASKSAIQICFGGKSGPERCRIIAEQDGVAIDMGLSAMPAGCHSYFEDDKGNSSNGKDLCVRTEALAYFKIGSAGSFFVYEPKTGKFGRYWDSD